MICVNVLWRNGDGVRFDHDYYVGRHIPMLHELLGDRLKAVTVDRGLGGLEPGSPPPFVAVTRLVFDSIEDFQAGFGEHGGAIRGDEPNFTDIEVQVQISDVAV